MTDVVSTPKKKRHTRSWKTLYGEQRALAEQWRVVAIITFITGVAVGAMLGWLVG